MAYLQDGYYNEQGSVASALPAARVAFIQKTYAHLAGAILAFAGLEAMLVDLPGIESVIFPLYGSTFGPILLMVGFIGSGFVARWWANSSTSRSTQYAGLALYVVAEVVIFLPLLYIANRYFADQHVIAKSGLITMGLFAGLSTAILVTKKDFSWMGPALCILGWLAFFAVIAACIFGMDLGLWFSFAMVALASGYIVYDTSNILHHYGTEQYVAASLELFASVALLFWYVLRIAMSFSNRN